MYYKTGRSPLKSRRWAWPNNGCSLRQWIRRNI